MRSAILSRCPAISGSDLDGSTGHLEMVEEEDGWMLDDYGDDHLRSAFLASIRTVDEGAVSDGCEGKLAI